MPALLTNSMNDQAQARGAAARTHLLSVATRPVWDIVGGAIDSIESHLFGPPLSFWLEDDDDGADTPACGYTLTDGGIAVVPIVGTLVDSEPSWWMSYLGYCSIPAIARAVTAAAADGNVKDILFDVDSPGGHVSGLAAACDAVWAVRQAGEKRVWAACKKVASAAYEIVSQCHKIYLAPDGMGGCIGTLYLLSDWSGYYTQMGVVNLRLASDGADTYKGAGARGTKITPAQQADFKRICNEYRTLFNGIIQRGRGFDDKTMLALADGRIHIGANALQLSLVDGIATPEAVLSALGGGDDLDDLAGPPSQQGDGEDEPDGDDDPTDLFSSPNDLFHDLTTFYQENNPLSTPQTLTPKTPTAEQASRTSKFIAWLTGEDVSNEASAAPPSNNPAPQAAEPHPVLVAALAAGLDTPEKVTALVTERNARQETDKTSAEQALTTAREGAQNAATTAFGAGSQELERAQHLIGVQTNVGVLSSMAAAYKTARPATLRPNAPRQTVAEQTQITDEAGSAPKPVNEGLIPGKVYAKRRAGK